MLIYRDFVMINRASKDKVTQAKGKGWATEVRNPGELQEDGTMLLAGWGYAPGACTRCQKAADDGLQVTCMPPNPRSGKFKKCPACSAKGAVGCEESRE